MTARSVGGYDVLRELGRGGMAMVYLARDREEGSEVALKELMALRVTDPVGMKRFLRESRLAGSLSHPCIVTVYEAFEYRGTPYIAMEYLARGSLRPWVGRLSTRQTLGVLRDVLRGLAHAEEHSIVHRDLKPENLLITGEGGVKITDYGLAKAVDQETEDKLTRTGMTLGTPDYIAPEQATAGKLGPATDLYSLGITAYELLCGRTPFEDAKGMVAVIMAHVGEPPPPLRSFAPRVDPALAGWVESLLVKDPQERPPGADAARASLEQIAAALYGADWDRDAAIPEPVAAAAGPGSPPAAPGAPPPPRALKPSWAGSSPLAGSGMHAPLVPPAVAPALGTPAPAASAPAASAPAASAPPVPAPTVPAPASSRPPASRPPVRPAVPPPPAPAPAATVDEEPWPPTRAPPRQRRRRRWRLRWPWSSL